MPSRSTGCFQCRKRRVKCDETWPGCERCAKHGVPCPGYRREKGGLEFEDQTLLTAKKAKTSYGGKMGLVVKKSPDSRSASGVIVQNINRDVFQRWSVTLPLSILASPAANQAQLYDKWLNIYMPKTCGMQGLHFDYLREAIDMAESEPALRDGLNTLALVQVGHAADDERLLAASVPSYGKALASLAYAVSKATSVCDNTVLAAASLLIVCEFYDKIKTQGMSWFGHVRGTQQLLLARGPDSLDTNLSLMLFCNTRHGSLVRSFLFRKGDSYDSPAWRAAAFRAPVSDWTVRLFDATIRVPRYLQRSDELDIGSPDALRTVRDLLFDCESLEAELRHWYSDYHASLHMHGIEPYGIVDVESFHAFAFYVSDRTLTTAYRFNNFLSGYLHSQFWTAMHYLRSTMKRLYEQRQCLETSPYDNSSADYTSAVTCEELNGYVFDLCRSIPHFVEPSSGTQGHIAIFLPLAVILMHFRSRRNWKWCSWGVKVKENVFSMGLRQPHVQDKDLPVSIVRPRAGWRLFPNNDISQCKYEDELEPYTTIDEELGFYPPEVLEPVEVFY
jgi:hypothetical protein